MTLHPIQLVATYAIIAFTALAPANAADTELLRNPGFEPPARGGVAHGWADNSDWADVDVTYALTEDGIAGAGQALEIARVTYGAVQLVQSGVVIKEGVEYRAGVWLRGHLDGPLEILIRKAGRPYTVYARRSVAVTPDWAFHQVRFSATASDGRAYFMLRATGKGKIVADDATLIKVSSSHSAQTVGHDLVRNGSFEVGLDRWAVRVREWGGYRFQGGVELQDARPAVITTAAHGGHALAIEVPPNGRAIVTSRLDRPTSPSAYVLKLSLKARAPDTAVLISVAKSFDDRAAKIHHVTAGPDWRSHQLPFELSDDTYHLRIETRRSTELAVDDVSMVPAAGTDVAARPAVGFNTDATSAPLFFVGEDVTAQVCIFAPKVVETMRLEVSSFDLDGVGRTLLSKEMRIGEAARVCESVNQPSGIPGYYSLEASITANGSILDVARYSIGILTPHGSLQSEDSPFGGHARFAPANLSAAAMLGVAWLRMHPPLGTRWFVVEPTEGQFAFQDEPILLAREHGFRLLGLLAGTPRWATTAPPDLNSEQWNGHVAFPPRTLEGWHQYVSRTVDRYRGVVDAWEVWNEPDSDFLLLSGRSTRSAKADIYGRLARSAAAAVHDAAPRAKIVVGSGTQKPPSRWVRELARREVLETADVLSFHYYTGGRPIDSMDVAAIDVVNALRAASGSAEIPIWETESGLPHPVCGIDSDPSAGEYCITPRESVAYVIRNYVSWLSAGVDKWFMYNMFFPDRTDRLDFTSFFQPDRSPTPLAIGYGVLARMLAGKPLREMLDDSTQRAATFANAHEAVRIAWKKSSLPTALIIPQESAAEAVVVDSMGRELLRHRSPECIALLLPDTPIYVIESL